MTNPKGYNFRDVAKKAEARGFVMVNQYDQSPRALRFRRAVYRAVKAGLLQRVKSPPSRAVYKPKGPTMAQWTPCNALVKNGRKNNAA